MSTEDPSERFADLDLWPTAQAVAAMAEDQARAAIVVTAQAEALADAADAAAERLRGGEGRLVYVGAGTSGRLAVQDGVELGPTFDWPESRLIFALAGGDAAVLASIEGAEDDAAAGAETLRAAGVGASDVVIALAASGQTPYTVAAVEAGAAAGALTIAIACNPETPLLAAAAHPILLETGPEAVAGSTRLKAGTAQKMALNLLSTAVMMRLGGVYRGQMVAMRATNAKLRGRAVRMVAQLAGVSSAVAAKALSEAGGRIKSAVLIAHGASALEARKRLDASRGDLRAALNASGYGQAKLLK